MTTVFEMVQTALDGALTVPVAQNVYMSNTSLPDVYVVHQMISSPPEQSADNVETLRFYRVQVTVYSRVGLVSIPDVITPMTAAGFRQSLTREIPKDLRTGHYGLAYDFTIVLDS